MISNNSITFTKETYGMTGMIRVGCNWKKRIKTKGDKWTQKKRFYWENEKDGVYECAFTLPFFRHPFLIKVALNGYSSPELFPDSQDNSRELQFMEIPYSDVGMLTAQLEILKVLLEEGDFLCFDDIVVKIKELPTPGRKMINEVISSCKLYWKIRQQVHLVKDRFPLPEDWKHGSAPQWHKSTLAT